MNKQIDFRIVSLVFSILVICLAIGFYAFAVWQEPTESQPGGNVPAPLNAGIDGQSKKGGLLLGNSSSVTNGLIVRYGNVGIGTTEPSQKLDVVGNIVASGTICDSNGCIGGGGGAFGVRTNKDSDDNTFAENNVYKVTSDGFLTVFSPSIPGAHHQDLYLYNDFNNPPITLFDSVKTGAVYTEDPRVSMDGVPIVKNTYWKVVFSGSGTITVFWTPIGSGVCVKQ